jgi:hypothetical protein
LKNGSFQLTAGFPESSLVDEGVDRQMEGWMDGGRKNYNATMGQRVPIWLISEMLSHIWIAD